MNIENNLLLDLGITKYDLENILRDGHRLVKLIKIPKKAGGLRKVYHPNKKLKAVQTWLKINYLDKIAIHKAASAFKSGASIVVNADIHRDNNFFIRMDLKDFFTSIKYLDLVPMLGEFANAENMLDVDADKFKELVSSACFDRNSRLVMGYPTSPVISNIVMRDFDQLLVSELGRLGSASQNVKYTRYADDMIFSFQEEGVAAKLKELVTRLVNENSSPDITLNTEKTRIFSKSSGVACITGVRVCADGHLTVFKKTKDELRLLLSLLAKDRLDKKDYNKVHGLLSFVKMVDSHFYTKIYGKHFQSIEKLYSNQW